MGRPNGCPAPLPTSWIPPEAAGSQLNVNIGSPTKLSSTVIFAPVADSCPTKEAGTATALVPVYASFRSDKRPGHFVRIYYWGPRSGHLVRDDRAPCSHGPRRHEARPGPRPGVPGAPLCAPMGKG